MTECQYWRVRTWLGLHVIEEHIAPTGLAEQYANVLGLRFPGRTLTCEFISEHEAALSSDCRHGPPQPVRN